MALFKIFKGLTSAFMTQDSHTKAAHDGYAYFTTDDGKFYIDIADSDKAVINVNRIPVGEEVSISGTQPTLGKEDIWIDTTSGKTYYKYGNTWNAIPYAYTVNNQSPDIDGNISVPTGTVAIIRWEESSS